jgi:hypothetical protein
MVSFLLAFAPKSYMQSSSPHSCYIPRPSNHPLLDTSNYTWQTIQVIKLLIMQFPQPPIKHLQSMAVLLSTGKWLLLYRQILYYFYLQAWFEA